MCQSIYIHHQYWDSSSVLLRSYRRYSNQRFVLPLSLHTGWCDFRGLTPGLNILLNCVGSVLCVCVCVCECMCVCVCVCCLVYVTAAMFFPGSVWHQYALGLCDYNVLFGVCVTAMFFLGSVVWHQCSSVGLCPQCSVVVFWSMWRHWMFFFGSMWHQCSSFGLSV